jgi:acetyl esterase
VVLFPEARRSVEAAADDVAMHSDAFDLAASRAQARADALAEPREDVAEVVDLDCDGVPARLYRPAGAGDGLVVHLHGGGFVFHDVDVHDPSARRLANRCGLAVLSVDYRRPPEHRFPAAPDDVDTVLAWLDRAGDTHGLRGPTFAHGDSAGGNLALVAALRHPGRFAAVALVYPFLDPTADFDSYATAADGFDPRDAAWYWQQYAATPADLEHPDLAPLRSDRLASLPPTLVVTAEHDPLRDEGEHLARLLAEAGVEVVATRYLGQVHGFWRHPAQFPAAEPLMRQVGGYLQMQAERQRDRSVD